MRVRFVVREVKRLKMPMKGEANIINIKLSEDDSNVKKIAICVAILLVIGSVAYYLYGRTDIHDNSDRVEQIGSDIRSAEQQQSDAIDRIDTVQNGLGNSAAEIGRAAETINTVSKRIDDSEARLNDSTDLIGQGKRIIATVRQRGTSGAE